MQLNLSISISKAVQMLKGGRSWVLRETFPRLEEFLWGESFWLNGYFVETVGKIDEQKMRNYIK